jgi:carboxylesterase type B
MHVDVDCLPLNVRPPRPDGRKRPLIVFIHGGAVQLRTGNEPPTGNVTTTGESKSPFSLCAIQATDHPERLFRHVTGSLTP